MFNKENQTNKDYIKGYDRAMKNLKDKPMLAILAAEKEAKLYSQDDMWDKGYIQAIKDIIKERI